MKASGVIGGNVVATGHAEEKRTASRINQTSALKIVKHQQLEEC